MVQCIMQECTIVLYVYSFVVLCGLLSGWFYGSVLYAPTSCKGSMTNTFYLDRTIQFRNLNRCDFPNTVIFMIKERSTAMLQFRNVST